MRKSEETIAYRVRRLRARKCRAGHSRADAYAEVDYRTGGIRLRCRDCHRARLRRYHAEGRAYRYGREP